MATQVPGRSACQAALRVSNEAAPGLCSRVRACRGGWFGHRLLAAEVPWCRDGAHGERRGRERMASRHDAMYEDRMLRGQWPQATAKYLRWRRFSRPSPPVAAAPGRARGTRVVDALRRAEAGPDRPAQDGGGVAAIPVRVLWGRPERPCGFPGPRRRIPAACAAFGDTKVLAQSSAPLLMMRRAVGMTTYALGRRISEAGRLVTTTVCRCGSAKSGSFSFFQSCKAAEILVRPWAHRLRCVSTELSFHFLGPPPATA